MYRLLLFTTIGFLTNYIITFFEMNRLKPKEKKRPMVNYHQKLNFRKCFVLHIVIGR